MRKAATEKVSILLPCQHRQANESGRRTGRSSITPESLVQVSAACCRMSTSQPLYMKGQQVGNHIEAGLRSLLLKVAVVAVASRVTVLVV